ncbi:ASPIC/UnbV domain-containing protein, partial [Acidobacteria bacterium AH-259-G07]|nr:ASPIC/UnbV domain-containing protein [Acidobacteria bacterium AH-259-G07]
DIVVSNSNEFPNLLVNQNGNRKNWILLKLVGHKSNRDGIGAKIRLVSGGRIRYDQVTGGGSYLSAHDARIHFGLGQAQTVDLIEIRWPSGIVDCLKGVEINQIMVIEEGSFASS